MAASTEPTTADRLRALADIYEQHPDLPPILTVNADLIWSSDDLSARDQLAEVARTLAAYGKVEKDTNETFYNVSLPLPGGRVQFSALRSLVCEKRVTTREVTELVPDPALGDVPMVEVTRTVEDVEWVCPESLLRPEPRVVRVSA